MALALPLGVGVQTGAVATVDNAAARLADGGRSDLYAALLGLEKPPDLAA